MIQSGKYSSGSWQPIHVQKEILLDWAQSFDVFTYLDNHSIDYPNQPFESYLAVGAKSIVPIQKHTFESLKQFHQENPVWLFGFLTYDLKNELEALKSENADGLQFPKAFFYEPIYLFHFQRDAVFIWSGESEDVAHFQQLLARWNLKSEPAQPHSISENPPIQQKTNKEKYLADVQSVRQHIEEGDVYELNYCMEFFAHSYELEPWKVFEALCEKSPMPFAAFQKVNDLFAICASPERFLKKEGQKLISQPIKGTAKRGAGASEDEVIKSALFNSEKERAENMMIVDLVRNDLARSCEIGSVKVEEIFGIYTFRQLHQMISTIVGELKSSHHFVDAIKHAFPMGSMTGAPKIKAMELIEQYEQSKRGLYSGAIGYISPNRDFDFNVVIRTILYNTTLKYLSFQVGSAITYDSCPEQEYEECLLKAKSMIEVLSR